MLSKLKDITTTFATLCSSRTEPMNIRIKDHTIGTRKGFASPSDTQHKIGDSFKEYKNPKDGTILSGKEYEELGEQKEKAFLINEGKYQNIENLMQQMELLHDNVIHRLDIYKNRETQKTFIDETTGKTRPASEALKPDETILNFINDFCLHVSEKFTKDAIQVLHDRMSSNPEFKKKMDALRELHVISYEFFENNMLDRIFSLNIDTMKGLPLMKIKKEIYEQAGLKPEEIANIKETLNPERALTPKESEEIIKKKTSILDVLVYDYHIRKAGNSFHTGTVSSDLYEAQMVENYDGIIKPEIELLTNTVLGEALFAKEDLKNKNLAFVGAGFPLSGVLQNIRTGINLTLIDLRKEACDNGNKILKILDILGVVKASDFNIIHKNALDLTYHNPTEDTPSGTFKENLNGETSKIYADILQLAADLPEFVAQGVMNNQKSNISSILKREGTTRRLYQSVSLPEYNAFKAEQQAATSNRKEAELTVSNVPCTVINPYQDNRVTTILYKNKETLRNEGTSN